MMKMYNYHKLIDTSFFSSEMGWGSSLGLCKFLVEVEVKVLAVPNAFPTTTTYYSPYSFSFFKHRFTSR